MKPRTKLQRLVVDLNKTLPDLSDSQIKWAYKECLPHKAYANKSSAFCLDCGNTFSLDLIKGKKAICPSCQTKVDVEYTRKRTYRYVAYFATASIVKEFQLIRNFELYAHYAKGNPVRYFLHEILQYWILPNGKITMMGLLHSNQDNWSGDFSIRIVRAGGYYYYNANRYDVYPDKWYPRSVFKKEYRKYGLNHRCKDVNALDVIKIVPENPHAETLLKAKQFGLFYRYKNYPDDIKKYWRSIKICMRNKYFVNEVSDWFDYLKLLEYFRKDIHNAKFICPKDLKKEHDILVQKKWAIMSRERKIRDLANEKLQKELKAKKLKIFKEKRKLFKNLVFKDKNIEIKCLSTLKEFRKEGDTHGHCLYTNDYHLKEYSLIFSASIEDTPMETIEYDILGKRIVQARGFGNEPTSYHNKILKVFNKHSREIYKILKSSNSNIINKQLLMKTG